MRSMYITVPMQTGYGSVRRVEAAAATMASSPTNSTDCSRKTDAALLQD